MPHLLLMYPCLPIEVCRLLIYSINRFPGLLGANKLRYLLLLLSSVSARCRVGGHSHTAWNRKHHLSNTPNEYGLILDRLCRDFLLQKRYVPYHPISWNKIGRASCREKM